MKRKYYLSGLFDHIQTVGKKGYLIKARLVWDDDSVLLSKYILDVEMLVNTLYK